MATNYTFTADVQGVNSMVDLYRVNYGVLPIGISAYEAFIKERYDKASQFLSDASCLDTSAIQDVHENEFMSFPLIANEDSDYVPTVTVSKAELARAINGDALSVNAAYVTTGAGVVKRYPASEIIDSVIRSVRSNGGMYGLMNYIKVSTVNGKWSISSFTERCKNMNLAFSFEDLPFVQSIPDGLSLKLVLGMITSSLQPEIKRDDENNDVLMFSKSDFTGGNAFICAVTKVTDTVVSLFSDIKFDVLKIGQFLKDIGTALGSLVVLVLQWLFPNLLLDYERIPDAIERAVDLPLQSVTVHSTVVDDHTLDLLTQTSQNGGGIFLATDAIIDPVDLDPRIRSFYPGVEGYFDFSCLKGIDLKAIAGGTNKQYFFPTPGGFLEFLLDGDVCQFNYYAGAHHSLRTRAQCVVDINMPDTENSGTIEFTQILSAPLKPGSYSVAPMGTGGGNADFAAEIKRYISMSSWDDELKGQDRIESMLPCGRMFRTISATPGYGTENDKSTAAETIDMFADGWSDHSDFSKLAEYQRNMVGNVLWCLLFFIDRNRHLAFHHMYYRPTLDTEIYELVEGEVQPDLYSYYRPQFSWRRLDSHPDITDDLMKGTFLPYYSNYRPSMDLHVQSDEERANEVITSAIRIFVAAAAIGATVGTVKLFKNLSVRKVKLDNDIFDCNERIRHTDGPHRDEAIKHLRKMQWKRKLLDKISFTMTAGNTIASVADLFPPSDSSNEYREIDEVLDVMSDDNAEIKRLISGASY